MIEGAAIQTVIFSIILGSLGIILSDKLRIPGILFYFALGIIFGPSFIGLLNPQSLGEGLSIMITVFVTIILFEGSLSLNIKEISSLKSILVKNISLTIVVMIITGFLAAKYIAGLPWEVALIFASLTVVTGPIVVKPIIRHIALSSKVKNFLNGEAVLINAVGAILAIITLEFILTRNNIGLSIAGFAGSLFAGAITGMISGFSMRHILCRSKIIPEAGNSFFILGSVLLTFASSELIVPESGLLSVVIAGLILSTMNYRKKIKVLNFKDQITRIIISILFVLLSANFDISLITLHLAEGTAIVVIIILARIPVIFISTAKEDFTFKEKLFMSWLAPRGIVALSVASIASIKLQDSGVDKAYAVEILIFMLISITVLFQGLSARRLAGRLNITVKGDRGLIILGVNEVSLLVAEKWRNDRTNVLFIDSNSKNCRTARQKGFLCIEGNALDSATYRGAEIENFTSALAASDNNEINIIFCRFLKETYGIENLYTVLNEKANAELAEIIKVENIKLAFGTRSKEEESFSWDGFLSRLKDVFSPDKQKFKWIKITSGEILKQGAGKYQLPQGAAIFMVLRNSSERYIYHTTFELRLNDEIFLMAPPEGIEKIQKIFTSSQSKEEISQV